MKILFSWLREFVDVPGTAEDVAVRMGVRGFAVEGIEPYGDEDRVIDFEVTANRPDCMSVIGMAREVAAAYGLPLRGTVEWRPSTTQPSSTPHHPPPSDIDIVIENPDLCPRYVGAVADVTMGPSPGWMQARLTAGGVRPISNIVDITNYVLLELGQPMHAFDHAKIGGRQIRIRTAKPGEILRTLDGEERALSPEMLVIADATEPIALAGIKGGAKSEIASLSADARGAEAATSVIVFESAHFNPLSVRRTSRKLGLKTDASMRFERGTDPGLPAIAMARACMLLEQIGAGKARREVADRYPSPVQLRGIHLRRARIEGLIGIAIPDADVERILKSLECVLQEAPGGWMVAVPTRRVDIVREVDLIEDVARLYGFDRIPSTFPVLTTTPPASDPRIIRGRQLRGVMTGAGFSEALTFGFIGKEAAAPFATDGELVPIANPLSENFAVLRPSVLPGLIDAVAHNRRREQRDVRLFEIGNRFTRTGGEHRALACAWTGIVGGDHWSGGSRDVDFFDLKGLVERVCEALGADSRIQACRTPWLVPGRSAAMIAANGPIGTLGQLVPAVAEGHGLPPADAVYVAEIDLDAATSLQAVASFRVRPLPRFPSVTRDIAILVGDDVAAEDIRRTIQEAAPPTLVRIREFDRYQGKGVPEGKMSLALRLTFRALDRTLTDAEVQNAMEAILAALKERHNAIQR
jgi:phenylalanyl-tRNA synthetase beta chain